MDLPSGLVLSLVVIFGVAIGSFLNVIIWRVPRGKKITGRSQCPNCKQQLKSQDLIPLLSYFLNKRQCHYCHKVISPRYAIIEGITALLFGITYLVLPVNNLESGLFFIFALFVVAVLIVVFVIDLEHYLILDKIILPATIITWLFYLVSGLVIFGFAHNWSDQLLNSILGSILGMAPLYLLWLVSQGKWMGFGDVKFLGFIGAVVGFPDVFVVLFLAFLIGTLVALPLLLFGKKELSSKLPFGTFLSVATVVTVWFGTGILDWYLNLIGLS